MDSAASLDETVAMASALLGEPLNVEADLLFSGRAQVARATRPDGSTVIVKRPSEQDAFQRELASYQVLPASLRAELLGARDGVLVIEDLGDGVSLAELLLGDDPARASEGLLLWARAVGALARASLGARPDPAHVRTRWGNADATALLKTAADLGVDRDTLSEEIRWIAAVQDTDGALTTFTPSDICPDNNRIDGDRIRFFDFEFSSWHNVGFDVSFCRLPFTTCWCVAQLPPDMPEQMEDALVAELGDVDREALDDSVVTAGAWWVLDTISSLAKLADDHLVRPPAPMTTRERARYRLRWLAEQGDRLPGCAQLAAACIDESDARYGAPAPVPLYSAFS